MLQILKIDVAEIYIVLHFSLLLLVRILKAEILHDGISQCGCDLFRMANTMVHVAEPCKIFSKIHEP